MNIFITGYDVSTASYDSNFSVAPKTYSTDIVFNATVQKCLFWERKWCSLCIQSSTGLMYHCIFINNFSVASQEIPLD